MLKKRLPSRRTYITIEKGGVLWEVPVDVITNVLYETLLGVNVLKQMNAMVNISDMTLTCAIDDKIYTFLLNNAGNKVYIDKVHRNPIEVK